MENDTEKKDENKAMNGKVYGNRPLWQWIIFYVVIAGLVYGIVYYIAAGRPNRSYTASQTSISPTQQVSAY